MEFNEQVQKVAKTELREDKSTREQCLHQMRHWLSKNDDVQDVRTDDSFLLRFLRTTKFSVPLAQQLLLKYLNFKNIFPQVNTEMDILNSPMKEAFESDYLFVSPIRDKDGRRVIISRTAKVDPHTWTNFTWARTHALAWETLLEDPVNQVMGFTHIADFSNATVAHLTMWRPSDYEVFRTSEKSSPVRHKAIHVINLPSTFKWAFDIFRRFLSSKLNDRMFLHSSWSEFNKKCDSSYLPKEMGGTIPMAEMIQWWKREMVAKRDIVVQLDKMKLLNDQCITKKDAKNRSALHAEIQAQLDSVAGSFRKLEID